MQVEGTSSLREEQGTLRVLLVENNLADQTALMSLLKESGYSVEAVGNGWDALAALEGRNFDVVLMDIPSSEMDSFEAITAIREREKVNGAHLPIVAVTSYALEQERERHLQPGLDARVSRPIQPAELLRTIEKLTKSALEDSCQSVRADQQTLKEEGALATVSPQGLLPSTVEAYALTKSRRLLAEIQAAIRAGDVKTIRQTADALKACITSVLAKEAFEAASTLEKTLHEDDLTRAQDACRRLRDAINSLNPTQAGKIEGR